MTRGALKPLAFSTVFCAAVLGVAAFLFPAAREEAALYAYGAASVSFLLAMAAVLNPGAFRPEYGPAVVAAGMTARLFLVMAVAVIVFLTMREHFRVFALSLLGYYLVYLAVEVGVVIKRYFLRNGAEAAHA